MLKSVFFLTAFFISLTLQAAPVTQFGRASSQQLSMRFKVLVWNVFRAKKENFERDLRVLSQNKDLFIFQEANLSNEFLEIIEKFPLFFSHAQSYLSRNSVKMGVMTSGSTAPVNSFGILSPVDEVKFATPKVCLFQTYTIKHSKKRLLVVNVHALNFVPNSDYYLHIDQLQNVLSSHRGPILVAGDFNIWNQERLEYVDQSFAQLGLKRLSFPEGRTYFPRLGRIFGAQTGGYLDQAYSRGLKVLKTGVYKDIESSDHKPLWIELELPLL